MTPACPTQARNRGHQEGGGGRSRGKCIILRHNDYFTAHFQKVYVWVTVAFSAGPTFAHAPCASPPLPSPASRVSPSFPSSLSSFPPSPTSFPFFPPSSNFFYLANRYDCLASPVNAARVCIVPPPALRHQP